MPVGLMNALQCAQVGLVYALALFLFPRLLFRERLRGRSLSYQFLFSLVVGNFYMVQVTFLLALPGFNNRVTMPLAAFGVALGVYAKTHWGNVKYFITNQWERFCRLITGSCGLKLYLRDSFRMRERARKSNAWAARHVWRRLPEWALLLFCLCVGFWYFSYQPFHYYGFGAPDLAVHENWINAMAEGNIFLNGVYPFGFHSMVYFLYGVFHLDIYVCLRFFGIIQSLCMVLALYLLLRRLCKSRYTPFVGMLVFLLVPGFNTEAFMRYSWSLPQEYGMLFIYPAVCSLWDYLKGKKRQDLALFGAAFSLTLSGHFYATIIAFLFCLAVGLAYFRRIWKRRMLVPILLCGVLSVLVSLAPLGIAFATGTPMEPSLNWALGVMQKEEEPQETPSQLPEVSSGTEGSGTEGEIDPAEPAGPPTLGERLLEKGKAAYEVLTERLLQDRTLRLAYFGCLCAVFLYCLVQLFRHNRNGLLNCWLSTGLYNVFLLLLLTASVLGLPNLMETFRTSIFAAYAVVLVFSQAADLVWQLFSGRAIAARTASVVLAGALCCTAAYLPLSGNRRSLPPTYFLQYNGAFLSMENIKREFPTQKWTIVSGSDEVRPIWNKGWHYETIDFLRDQTKAVLNIPTQYVFFFVEKKPLVYDQVLYQEEPEILCWEISKEAADTPLFPMSAASDYYQRQRNVVMSKLYYYLQDFQKRYPNELRVYYEDDEFVCYMLRQDEYSLLNFAFGEDHFLS